MRYFPITEKNTKIFFIACFPLIAITSMLIPIAILALPLFTIFILGIVLPLPRKTYFFKIIFAAVILLSINTIIGGIFWLLKSDINPSVLFAAYYVIALILLVRNATNNRQIFISKSEIMLSFAVFLLCTPMVQILLAGNNYFRILGFASDHTSHIELVSSVYREKGYYYTKPEIGKNSLTETLSGYPQGLHINTWVFSQPIDNQFSIHSSPKKFVVTSFAFFMVIYALFILTLGLIFISLSSRISGSKISSKKQLLLKKLSALAVITALSTGIFFSMFALGFHSQILSMLFFVGQLYFLYQYLTYRKIALLAISWLMVVGISFSWLFLLPLSILIMAIVYLSRLIIPPLLINLKNYRKELLLAIVFFSFCFIQIFVQLYYSSGKNLGINEDGFSPIINFNLVVSSFIFLTAYLLSLKKTPIKNILLYVTLATGATSASIYLFQEFTLGYQRYYYFKSLFILLIPLSCILVLLLSELLPRFLDKNNSTIISLLLILFLFLPTYFNILDNSGYFTRFKSGGISNELTDTIVKLILEDKSNGAKIIAVGSCDRAQDFNANKITGTLTNSNTAYRQALLKTSLSPSYEELIKGILEYTRNSRISDAIIISTNSGIESKLMAQLGSEHFRYINLDFSNGINVEFKCPSMVK